MNYGRSQKNTCDKSNALQHWSHRHRHLSIHSSKRIKQTQPVTTNLRHYHGKCGALPHNYHRAGVDFAQGFMMKFDFRFKKQCHPHWSNYHRHVAIHSSKRINKTKQVTTNLRHYHGKCGALPHNYHNAGVDFAQGFMMKFDFRFKKAMPSALIKLPQTCCHPLVKTY